MQDLRREQLSVGQEKAILAGVLLPGMQVNPHDPLDELRSLTETAGAIVVDELMQKRQTPDPATFMGKGKIEELKRMADAHDAQVLIFENDLSPSQIGKIEKGTERKVLDRSELILDIFAARAQTLEARIQVELAQLEYTYPRLRAMWTHLERIAGGAPAGIGTRGPGEQQLEIDRRIVQRKKAQLRREIAEIHARKQREVAARKEDHFTVGLVGYTNAGKSTLFNRVTEGGAYADDKLFATLSTRTRRWDLGDGDAVMLSDTVGFVRDLPHHLVASFRATLEEAIHADILLVVLDASDPRAREQLETVDEVLDDIGAREPKRVLLLNKVDRLHNNSELLIQQAAHPEALAVSAKDGGGVEAVIEKLRAEVRGRVATTTLDLPVTDGKALSILETRAHIIERAYHGDRVHLQTRLGGRLLDELKAISPGLRVLDVSGAVVVSDAEKNGSWGG
ncbi:GTPase HflX [Mucisphaera calidilacus]|uniref:GTPase HflX n=1 Tax=Mucisphaera calidilacus TaxID=2527982 RepID=A0A518BZ18_9BACT|nr:GTPase HflX [Mucisphaera calidilacus]QDU72215.1 GTPase HflX [Mucisphaera calidilacus]